jgi:hypothetical protein
MKLIFMKFSPLPCYLAPLRPKYSPQHPTGHRRCNTEHALCTLDNSHRHTLRKRKIIAFPRQQWISRTRPDVTL